jgi:hypothetical protein
MSSNNSQGNYQHVLNAMRMREQRQRDLTGVKVVPHLGQMVKEKNESEQREQRNREIQRLIDRDMEELRRYNERNPMSAENYMANVIDIERRHRR